MVTTTPRPAFPTTPAFVAVESRKATPERAGIASAVPNAARQAGGATSVASAQSTAPSPRIARSSP
ncbi:hypothetical protein [Burkholderia cenocepacia]|uniref:hypothetical protein n=1 Tax=Burkholderia cenocepacia TaxID=95486 RepID=UPI00163D2433|nr:hypothetical protein [Burkholderia cenocepacia]